MIDFSEKSYIDSVVTRAFGREDADADISGTVRATHFTKLDPSGAIQRVGRKRYKGVDGNGNPVFEKVKDDVQFGGKGIDFNGIDKSIKANSSIIRNITPKKLAFEFYCNKKSNTETIILAYEGFPSGASGTAHLQLLFNVPNDGNFALRLLGGANNEDSTYFYCDDSGDIETKKYTIIYDPSFGVKSASAVKIKINNELKTTSTTDLGSGFSQFRNDFNATEQALQIAKFRNQFWYDVFVSNFKIWDDNFSDFDDVLNGKVLPSSYIPLQSPNNVYDVIKNESWQTFNLVEEDWIPDDSIDYSHLNQKGYNVDGSGNIIPASLSNPDEDVLGNPLEFKGSLAPRLQLLGVNNAYILNGVDQSIRVGYEPSFISINGVDDTANWTITDIGGGNWDISPNAEKTIYNLLIDDKHYPCSDDDGIELAQYPINTNPATITNATLPDILTSVDDFHQHFYYGYWKYEDANGNQVQRPSDCGSSFIGPESVIFNRIGFIKGFKQTGKWNGAGKLYFPDIPEMPIEVRGLAFTLIELMALDYVVLKYNGTYVWNIQVVNLPLISTEKVRQGFYSV